MLFWLKENSLENILATISDMIISHYLFNISQHATEEFVQSIETQFAVIMPGKQKNERLSFRRRLRNIYLVHNTYDEVKMWFIFQ